MFLLFWFKLPEHASISDSFVISRLSLDVLIKSLSINKRL